MTGQPDVIQEPVRMQNAELIDTHMEAGEIKVRQNTEATRMAAWEYLLPIVYAA